MKKIIIETPAGTHPKYKLWAKEAAEEMLALFPEYKSSFKAEFSDCRPQNKSEIDVNEYVPCRTMTINKNLSNCPTANILCLMLPSSGTCLPLPQKIAKKA